MKTENIDVLVIGAGPSGCVSSAYLNKNGINVKVVEKTKFPRPVIGESLIPKVMNNFEEVGFLPAIKKAGFEIKSASRFIREDVDCTFYFNNKFGEGWDWTWQVPRADFDLVLAEEAQRQGVEIEFEAEVIGYREEGDFVIVTLQDKKGNKKEIKTGFVIDSSGYGRVLPKLMNLEAPSNLTGNSSIFTHTKDAKRPKGVEGTQITFEVIEKEIWLWIIPFSNGVTSIGVVGKTELIEGLSANKDAEEALRNAFKRSHHYTERFVEDEFLFPPMLKKNYACTVSKMFGNKFALTGNSSGFLDPVFSSGVALATTSGLLASKLLTRQLKGDKVDWQKEYADYMNRGYDVFSTYVKEWYNGNLQTLFFHRPANEEVKKKICGVLAGYAWNDENPFVSKHDRAISSLAKTLEIQMKK